MSRSALHRVVNATYTEPMPRTIDSLSVQLHALIIDFLDLDALRNLDDAVDEAPWWASVRQKLHGNTYLESAWHDLFDLDWLQERQIRLRRVRIATSKSPREYPFQVDPPFFGDIKRLVLQDNAFAFLKGAWSPTSSCNMKLTSLSLSGETMRFLQNKDLEGLLSKCFSVEELDMKGLGDGISDDLFIDFSQDLEETSLKKLSLHFCEQGTDLRAGLNPISFMCLAPRCSALVQLELRNTFLLTDECLLMFSMHCQTLETVVLQCCRALTGAGVRILCNANERMRQLILLDCTSLNDSLFFGNGVPNPDGSIIPGSGVSNVDRDDRRRSLSELWKLEGSKVWANLEYLALDECEGFSNNAIRHLSLLTPNLERFSATNCYFLTDETFLELYRSLGNEKGQSSLQDLCLYGIDGIMEGSMLALTDFAPNLKRVGLTARLDHQVMKDLEARGVQVDWIPWWSDS